MNNQEMQVKIDDEGYKILMAFKSSFGENDRFFLPIILKALNIDIDTFSKMWHEFFVMNSDKNCKKTIIGMYTPNCSFDFSYVNGFCLYKFLYHINNGFFIEVLNEIQKATPESFERLIQKASNIVEVNNYDTIH